MVQRLLKSKDGICGIILDNKVNCTEINCINVVMHLSNNRSVNKNVRGPVSLS